MATINRIIVLNTLIMDETLTIGDIAKQENHGMISNGDHLQFLLTELNESGHIHFMSGVVPSTFTTRNKGIIEGARLNKEGVFFNCLTCKIQGY